LASFENEYIAIIISSIPDIGNVELVNRGAFLKVTFLFVFTLPILIRLIVWNKKWTLTKNG